MSLSLEITPREAQLILKYGYPFEAIMAQCKAILDTGAARTVVDDAYWWEQLAGNLAISVNDGEVGDDAFDEVNELADRIEERLAG